MLWRRVKLSSRLAFLSHRLYISASPNRDCYYFESAALFAVVVLLPLDNPTHRVDLLSRISSNVLHI